MKTKIYHGRDLIGRFTCDGRNYTRFQLFRFKCVRLIKRSLLVSAAMSVIGWTAVGSYYYAKNNIAPQVVEAEVIREVPVLEAPVLGRIAKCESGARHTKNGQVIVNVNNNGTYDTGYYQINSIWNKKATEMGLNLAVEEDNKAFGEYLYKNFGTEPWYSSKPCWNN